MNIPITKPLLGEEEVESASEVIRSGWLAQGKKVEAFEQIVAETVGAKEAVAVSSCTTALHIALRTAGFLCGDWACLTKPCVERCEIICPSYTFVATINALLYLGIKPVLVDIDAQTGNIDPDLIETAITPRTRAIIPVHQLGYPADLDRVHSIASEHDLVVIEDAACALGAQYKSKPIGAHSQHICFSFHPRKAVTTAEGGVIATNDSKIADHARILRSHGASVSAETRHKLGGGVFEQYVDVGFNFRMSDVHAAIGIEQMKRLPAILKRRRALAQNYTNHFKKTPEILPPIVPEDLEHAYQTYAIRLSDTCKVDRDEVIQRLSGQGVSCRRGIPPVHLEPYFEERFGRIHLPVTERVSTRTIFLPLYPQMTEEEQSFVISNTLQGVVRL